MGERLQSWMQSDLIGLFATIAVLVTAALALAIFFLLGPIAGILFGCAIAGLTVYLFSRSGGGTAEIGDIAPPSAETAQQILVIANQGLASAALEDELGRRAEQGPLEVRLVAPAPAQSLARRISDDVDLEVARAGGRIDAVLSRLSERGIAASGHVDEEASPERCLLDGLRRFPADEVLLVPADELDWSETETLAGRLRAETDVRVTELDA
jgi:hypothetical protein